MNGFEFCFAADDDLESVQQLLAECELPYEDVANHLTHFILAKKDAQLVGVVGLEILKSVGLLRSLAVSAPYRDQGLGNQLYTRILAYARLRGINQLYLLTLTAASFFSELGFQKVDREQAPEALQKTEEFRNLCPDTAVCMVKHIMGEAQYYPGAYPSFKKFRNTVCKIPPLR